MEVQKQSTIIIILLSMLTFLKVSNNSIYLLLISNLPTKVNKQQKWKRSVTKRRMSKTVVLVVSFQQRDSSENIFCICCKSKYIKNINSTQQ